MRDKQVARYLEGWTGFTTGEISNGKPETRVSLSKVLWRGPIAQRYYLSQKACAGILRRAANREKELPPALKAALEAVAGGMEAT